MTNELVSTISAALLNSDILLGLSSLLEALSVHDGWSKLVVLASGDPHAGEGGEGGQDGSSDPDTVLTFWWGNNLDLHRGRSEGGDLLAQSLGDVREHSGTSRKADVSVQVLTDIDLALHDGVVGEDVDTLGFHADQVRLEKNLWASEPLVADSDDLAVRHVELLLETGATQGGLHLLLEVRSDVSQPLLDVTHDLSLGGGVEEVSTLGQDLHQVVRQVSSCKI